MQGDIPLDAASRLLAEIREKREQIKEFFAMAFLAATIPDNKLHIDYLIKNVRMVEKWEGSIPNLTVTWYFELKNAAN